VELAEGEKYEDFDEHDKDIKDSRTVSRISEA
jgi:hypothetical protein